MFVLLTIAIVPIIVISYLTYTRTDIYLEKTLTSSFKGISEIKYRAIEATITDSIDQVERGVTSLQLIASISELKAIEVEEEKSTAYEKLRNKLNGLLGESAKFEEVFIIGASGMITTSTNKTNENKDAKDYDYFVKGKAKTFIQGVFLSPITEKPSIVISTPITKEDKTLIGVLAVRLNLDSLYSVVRDYTGLGETGETVIVALSGNDVVILNPTRFDEKAALEKRITIGDTIGIPLQMAAEGKSGQGFSTDYRGVKVLASWRYISVVNWGLVTKMDAKEVAQPKKEMAYYILLACILIAFIIFLVAFIMASGIVKPIKDLTDAADRISKGDLGVQINIKSRDEIGKLAESFERMLAAIKYLKEKE
ncbi:MAG: cache domain-containing protein [Parcubacteria group bacterium]